MQHYAGDFAALSNVPRDVASLMSDPPQAPLLELPGVILKNATFHRKSSSSLLEQKSCFRRPHWHALLSLCGSSLPLSIGAPLLQVIDFQHSKLFLISITQAGSFLPTIF
jgi:hypothetical protein